MHVNGYQLDYRTNLSKTKEENSEQLKILPDIKEDRSCKKCTHYKSDSLIMCKTSCNFAHDSFVPRKED